MPLPVGELVGVSAGAELEGLPAQPQVEVEVPRHQLQREEVTLQQHPGNMVDSDERREMEYTFQKKLLNSMIICKFKDVHFK